MARNLVIVESPAKARTLAKYLGRNYLVKASVGHIIDLPKSKLGVDVEKDFKPDYQVIRGKAKIIEDLKKAAKGKEAIFLAPDPDREGEAIAWHIADKLGRALRPRVRRVLLYEITKQAVQEALKRPQDLNQDRFEAQVARRILDRLVGYQLSPLLWKKVRRGLSAGRVQSVALRIVCEREREIQRFVPEEYWSVTAQLEGPNPPPFEARLVEVGGQRLDNKSGKLESKERVDQILAGLGVSGGAGDATLVPSAETVAWVVSSVETKERRRNPAPPFITSKLQQEASRKLNFSPRRTMRIAQRLYEGVELGDEGALGLITYMRTDSTRVSNEAIGAVRTFIGTRFGEQYLPAKPVAYRSKRSAQDAHEAIRPTSMEYDPDHVAPYLSKEELALYTLIWNRFTASQMAPAVFDHTAADIAAGNCRFRATGQTMKFDGFIRVYTEGRDDDTVDDEEGEGRALPPLAEGMPLALRELVPLQHFTQPPPRFTQATLIKELEENGIGRPSTYATIMTTLLDKEYAVEGDGRRLRPTELGFLITDLLVESFPDVLNVEFTAGMEDVLDRIEDGKESWQAALRRFHEPFQKDLERADVEMRNVKREEQPTDIPCEKCGANMVVRWGRRGEFLACPRYPECRNTKNFRREGEQIVVAEHEETDETCEKCGKPMRVRVGRYGKFLGCSGYPECNSIRPLVRPTSIGMRCPDCRDGDVLERRSRRGKVFYGCSAYPKCRFAVWDRPVSELCPRCSAPYLVEKVTKRYGTVRRCVREGCDYQEQMDTPAEAEA